MSRVVFFGFRRSRVPFLIDLLSWPVATFAGNVGIELAAINHGRSLWKTGYLMIRFAASTMDRTPIP